MPNRPNGITRYGITWYCQTAGRHWATDPITGLHLKWAARTRSWRLCRDEKPGTYADTECPELRSAMLIVGRILAERREHGHV